ncbi:hypothetical protein AX16_010559 [Volvariella volvacea WC 439]|nr:hypothetical protein AX16_010559 [Volvariella volvacea WC 439]
MSIPSPGIYVIVNRVLSPYGEQLAITFNGVNQPLTVTARSDSPNQKWLIRNYLDGGTQFISPITRRHLEACWGPGVASVLPAGLYVWTLRESESGLTIQDGGVTVFWGVENARNDDSVTIGEGTGAEKQRWILVRVSEDYGNE